MPKKILPIIKASNKALTLINFNQDYYYDIKTKVTKKTSFVTKHPEVKEKPSSKNQINKEIIYFKNKLKAIEQETSIPYQELKLALQRRIKYLENQLKS